MFALLSWDAAAVSLDHCSRVHSCTYLDKAFKLGLNRLFSTRFQLLGRSFDAGGESIDVARDPFNSNPAKITRHLKNQDYRIYIEIENNP